MGRKTLSWSAARVAAVLAIAVGACVPAHAVSISYKASNESANTWVYSYSVANDSLAAGLSEFRILFALGEFDDLEVVESPVDWDSIAADPDAAIPDDGFFDSLLLTGTLALGQTASGFKVRFTWLGGGTPGTQSFVVLDASTFETLFSGKTMLDGVAPPPAGVSEPGTLGLLAIAIGMLGVQVRSRRPRAAH